MEKEKTLTVTLDQAREWYKKVGELRELALRCFSEEDLLKDSMPKTCVECLRIYMKSNEGEYINNESIVAPVSSSKILHSLCDRNILPNGMAKPMLALCQLLICREVYRDGWKPDWTNEETKYVIEYYGNKIIKEEYIGTSYILSFQSEEIRNEFYKNFKDLIEEAKELI